MKLFAFELKKLLLNKRSILFILVFAVLYVALGVGNGLFTFQGTSSFREYSNLAANVVGPKQDDIAKEATDRINELTNIFGSSHSLKRHSSKNSQDKLYYNYYQYLGTVDAYYNGTASDEKDEPTGILPLESKLKELEEKGESDSYQYKKLNKVYEQKKKVGAPEFNNVILWETLYESWYSIMMLILLGFPLAFLLASVYTKEVHTGMDNIILSSRKGRASIVFAKLGAVSDTSIVFSLIFFICTFIGNFIPYMSLEGATASVRSLSSLASSTLNMNIISFVLLTILWGIVFSLVFGIIVSFISSLLKSQAAVFGCGIIVLLLGIILEAFGSEIVQRIQLLVDFCFTNTISAPGILGSTKFYNVFGLAIPYWLCTIVVFLALVIVSILLTLRQQKHRTIA